MRQFLERSSRLRSECSQPERPVQSRVVAAVQDMLLAEAEAGGSSFRWSQTTSPM